MWVQLLDDTGKMIEFFPDTDICFTLSLEYMFHLVAETPRQKCRMILVFEYGSTQQFALPIDTCGIAIIEAMASMLHPESDCNGDSQFMRTIQQDETMPVLSPEEVRAAAAAAFQPATATGSDMLHPRSFAHLGNGAARGAAAFMRVFDTAAAFPADACVVYNSHIPKPTGGLRPIGLCSALFRVWGATRKALMKEWHLDYARKNAEVAAGPEKDSADPVWQGMVMAEVIGRQDDGVGSAVNIFDMFKFVDTVGWALAWDMPERAGCPRFITQAVMQAYTWARHIRKGRIVAEGIAPARVWWPATPWQCPW